MLGFGRRLAFAATVVAALALVSCAQPLPSAPPDSVGLSAERLNRIATAVQDEIDKQHIAGAVTLVARHGKIGWWKAQGMADRENNKPMAPDSLFRICSMTKPITSVAVMMLYEEGKFLLDDPVSKYIPEFKNPKVLVKEPSGRTYTVPAKNEITIRNLLSHTAGLTYHWNPDLGPMYREAKVSHGLEKFDGTNADSIKHLATMPLLFNPGERFEYGLNLDVLGYLVEVVSGESLAQFLQERIFDPLGMKDTYFFVPEDKVGRFATVYGVEADKPGLQRFPEDGMGQAGFKYSADYPYRGPEKLYSGGGGLSSTAGDYLRFCQMLLNGGVWQGKRLLGRKSIELMTHDQLGQANPDFGFGLGFGVAGAKGPLHELGSQGEFSWGGFYYTAFTIDPKEEMITIFMAQLHPTNGSTLDKRVHALAYQAIAD